MRAVKLRVPVSLCARVFGAMSAATSKIKTTIGDVLDMEFILTEWREGRSRKRRRRSSGYNEETYLLWNAPGLRVTEKHGHQRYANSSKKERRENTQEHRGRNTGNGSDRFSRRHGLVEKASSDPLARWSAGMGGRRKRFRLRLPFGEFVRHEDDSSATLTPANKKSRKMASMVTQAATAR